LKRLIIASTSTLHGQDYLEYLLPELQEHFVNSKSILFLPYARPGGITHDRYTAVAQKAFDKIGISVKGLHEFKNPINAIEQTDALFTGGGNTFVLVKQLHDLDLISSLKRAISNGVPYLGTSAGSNICGLNMQTTNDMPIVYPKSFKTLGIVPFNINPHYLDPLPERHHMGETREQRIKEFHTYNTTPVVGLREGSWLKVSGDEIYLEGTLNARIFEANKTAYEIPAGTSLKRLGI
jgi:dipeptidase E